MTVDPATTAWETMLDDANDTAAVVSQPGTLSRPVVVALRTILLLVVAALAILVLLPAALSAQAAYAG